MNFISILRDSFIIFVIYKKGIFVYGVLFIILLECDIMVVDIGNDMVIILLNLKKD